MFDLRDWLTQSDSGPPPVPDAEADTSQTIDETEELPAQAGEQRPLEAGFDLNGWLAAGLADPPAFLLRDTGPTEAGWADRARGFARNVPPLTGVAAALFLASVVILATGFSVPGLVSTNAPGGPSTPAPEGGTTPTPGTPAATGTPDASGQGPSESSGGTPTPAPTPAPTTDGDTGAGGGNEAAAQDDEETARETPEPETATTPTPTSTPTPTPGIVPEETPTLTPDDGGGDDTVVNETIDAVVDAISDGVSAFIGGSRMPTAQL